MSINFQAIWQHATETKAGNLRPSSERHLYSCVAEDCRCKRDVMNADRCACDLAGMQSNALKAAGSCIWGSGVASKVR